MVEIRALPLGGPTPAAACGEAVGELQQLGAAEQFVVWALRRRAEGRAGETSLQLGFVMGFGIARVEPALAALHDLAGAWERGGRRPPRFGPRPCPRLARDERAAVALVAARQRGDAAHAAALAAFLVRPGQQAPLLAGAGDLATLLADRGLLLEASPQAARPATGIGPT